MTTYLILAGLLLLVILLICNRSKRAKNKVIHIIDDNCTGCQRCLKKCRHKALGIISNEVGLLAVLKYPEKCTACGDCTAVCKFNALELVCRNNQ